MTKIIQATKRQEKKILAIKEKNDACALHTYLNWDDVYNTAQNFADHLENSSNEIKDILLEYETYEVIEDEMNRSLDLLRNLEENKEYFQLRVCSVSSFLPKNQPLYALTCFVIIPSLMSGDVHFRIPHSMRHFFPKLLDVLDFADYFPNVTISDKERLDFLTERSALYVDTETEETTPVTDAVIFTGTSHHAEKLRLAFDKRTLFITNGSGHNPVIISEDADLDKAARSVLRLQLYNQGQDCAAPNAILVHSKVHATFLKILKKQLSGVKVGDYRNTENRVGPVTDAKELIRIQSLFVENREWLDTDTPGLINSIDSIIQPTIINKPLKEGGNFTEVFAPVVFLQSYEMDSDLSLYFENSRYALNAMYVTLFGESNYIKNLLGKPIEGKILHDESTFIQNTDLHEPGVERGTEPYGGYGYSASNLSINGKVICKPTLPQRDIFEWLVKPFKPNEMNARWNKILSTKTKIRTKDVKKLFRMKNELPMHSHHKTSSNCYIDTESLNQKSGVRYVKIMDSLMSDVLEKANVEHIASMEMSDLKQIRTLRSYFAENKKIRPESLSELLYEIPKKEGLSKNENKKRQIRFFGHVYQLLLGKTVGPRLNQFLLDVDREAVMDLLNV